jgi:hypothetical protein
VTRRRLLLCVSIVANLGLLCYFKYANFFLQSPLIWWSQPGETF